MLSSKVLKSYWFLDKLEKNKMGIGMLMFRSNSLHSTLRDSRMKAVTGHELFGIFSRSFSSSGEEDELRSTTEISSLADEFFDDSDYSIHSDSGERDYFCFLVICVRGSKLVHLS